MIIFPVPMYVCRGGGVGTFGLEHRDGTFGTRPPKPDCLTCVDTKGALRLTHDATKVAHTFVNLVLLICLTFSIINF